jgi:hypothetical protein
MRASLLIDIGVSSSGQRSRRKAGVASTNLVRRTRGAAVRRPAVPALNGRSGVDTAAERRVPSPAGGDATTSTKQPLYGGGAELMSMRIVLALAPVTGADGGRSVPTSFW